MLTKYKIGDHYAVSESEHRHPHCASCCQSTGLAIQVDIWDDTFLFCCEECKSYYFSLFTEAIQYKPIKDYYKP
jgi:hypothetical protein